jgi:hypothetical protein
MRYVYFYRLDIEHNKRIPDMITWCSRIPDVEFYYAMKIFGEESRRKAGAYLNDEDALAFKLRFGI